MTRDANNAFRLAHWPGQVVNPTQVPGIPIYPYTLDGLWLRSGDAGVSTVRPPEELYLDGLMKLVVASPESVVEFLRLHGWLWPLDWGYLRRVAEGYRTATQIEAALKFVRLAAMQRGTASPDWDAPTDLLVIEATEQLRLARDASRYYIAATGHMDVGEALASSESVVLPAPAPEVSVEKQREWVATALEEIVNIGLREFPMTVRVSTSDLSRPTIWHHSPTLFGILCLQIANHIAEGANMRRCANESCRRWFVRQSGRSEYGQHRTSGVLYCSPACARTQGSRDWRRRKRAEQKEDK